MYHKILDNCSLAIIIKRLSVKKGCHNSKRIYTICLRPVKTLTAVREIDVPDILHNHLKGLIRKQANHPTAAYLLRKSEIVIDKTKRDYKQIIGGDFINRKENGELLTVNSIKFWAKKKSKLKRVLLLSIILLGKHTCLCLRLLMFLQRKSCNERDTKNQIPQ